MQVKTHKPTHLRVDRVLPYTVVSTANLTVWVSPQAPTLLGTPAASDPLSPQVPERDTGVRLVKGLTISRLLPPFFATRAFRRTPAIA